MIYDEVFHQAMMNDSYSNCYGDPMIGSWRPKCPSRTRMDGE